MEAIQWNDPCDYCGFKEELDEQGLCKECARKQQMKNKWKELA